MDQGEVEVDLPAGAEASGELGSASEEGVSLMQLELNEEDQPAVVPYEEVCAAAGQQGRGRGGGDGGGGGLGRACF